MTKEDFEERYNNVYIKCYTLKQLKYLVETYASNLLAWGSQLTNNEILSNNYNDEGVIIKFRDELECYWGYYDHEVDTFINYEDLFKKTKENTKNSKMHKITRILENIYNDKDLRSKIVPLFMSDPGHGKSQLIHEFAKSKGVNIVELITSQMSPFEISGICIPSHTKERMVYYNFDSLENLKDDDILLFDELPNGNPSVLNACLTLIEGRRMISGKKLPNIMIVAAGNPQGMTPMTPQIKERFVWYDLSFDERSWIKYMIKKYDITSNIGEKLAFLVKEEKHVGQNFNTPRSIDKAVNMIIKKVETPYSTKILPILETLITNTQEDIELKDGSKFLKNESRKWIDLIRIENNIL